MASICVAAARPAPRLKTAARETATFASVRRIGAAFGFSLLGLVGVAYVTFDPVAFREAASGLRGDFLVLAVAAAALRVAMGAWGIYYAAARRLTFATALRAQLAWYCFSNVAPSPAGGALLATAYLARDSRIGAGEVTAVMTFTMLLDQVWVFVLLVGVTVTALHVDVVPAATGLLGTGALLLPTLVMSSWVALLGYGLFARAGRLEDMLARLLRFQRLARFREPVSREARSLYTRLQALRARHVSFHVTAFAIMGGTWIARFLVLLFVVASMTPAFDALLLLLRGVTMTVLGLFVPTPGGAGGVEAMYVLFFDALLPAALLAPTLVIWRFLVQYVFLAGGIYLWLHARRARSELHAPALPIHASQEIRS